MNLSSTKSVRVFRLAVLVGLTALVAGACTKDNSNDPRNLTPLVSIEGSDTMSVLLDRWKEAFMKENPDIPVSVSVVDSGAGVKALLDRRTDIAASSRDLTNEENVTVHDKNIHLERRIVALDSIAVIVNPEATIDEISMVDLRKVFTGAKAKWSDLGTKTDEALLVCVREPDSGTSRYFSEHVMRAPSSPKTAPLVSFAKTARVLTSNEALIEAVAGNKNAIGFIALSNAVESKEKVKILKVKLLETSEAVMPSLKATTDDYSLSRPLYMFFDRKPKPSTRKFVDFCLSDKGQAIVKDNGFVNLK